VTAQEWPDAPVSFRFRRLLASRRFDESERVRGRGHRIVVQFKPTAESAGARVVPELCDEIRAITSGTLVRPPTATGRAVFQIPPSSDLDQLMHRVRSLEFVGYVEPDVVDRAQ